MFPGPKRRMRKVKPFLHLLLLGPGNEAAYLHGCYVVLWGNSKPGKQIAIIDANIAKYAGIDNRSITSFMFVYLHVS